MRPECNGALLGDCLMSTESRAISEERSEVYISDSTSKRLLVDTTTRHPGARPMSRPSQIQAPNRTPTRSQMTASPPTHISSRGPINRQHQSMVAHANRMRQKRQSGGSVASIPQNQTSKKAGRMMTTTTTTDNRFGAKPPPLPTRGYRLTGSSPVRSHKEVPEKRNLSAKVREIKNRHSEDTSMAAVEAVPAPAEKGEHDQQKNEENECDYDKSATVLYELLEASSWEEVKDRSQSHPGEVKTWIIRRDKNLKVRWKLLPLHASIIFQAPNSVVTCLLEIYKLAAQREDDQGMLPLHLAFRHKQEDEDLLEALLKQFPKGVILRDNRERVPLDHGRDLKFSTKIMKVYAGANVAAMGLAGEREQRAAPTSLVTARRQQPASNEVDLTTLNHRHKEEIVQIKNQYEERIIAMKDRFDRDAQQSKKLVGDERKDLVEGHRKEIAKLRRFLSIQSGRESTVMHDLQAQIDDVQTALENANRQNEEWAERYKAMELYGNELRTQLNRVIQDQTFIRDLAVRQTNELESARKIRSQIVQTLIQQEDTDGHNDNMRASKLLEVAENVRDRVQQLLELDPRDEKGSRQFERDERRDNQNENTSLKPDTRDQGLGLNGIGEVIVVEEQVIGDMQIIDEKAEIRPLRSLGDEISAITEHSP